MKNRHYDLQTILNKSQRNKSQKKMPDRTYLVRFFCQTIKEAIENVLSEVPHVQCDQASQVTKTPSNNTSHGCQLTPYIDGQD